MNDPAVWRDRIVAAREARRRFEARWLKNAEAVFYFTAEDGSDPIVFTKEKHMFKKILRGLQAAVTSPDAVKQERSLAALVVTRVLLAVGASTALVEFVSKFIHG